MSKTLFLKDRIPSVYSPLLRGHFSFCCPVLPFSKTLPSFLPFSQVPSSMSNENQTLSRPNQDVFSWMSLIMGWVNSEFRCCRGIKSQDDLGLIEGNCTNTAQWALVSNIYYLLTSEGWGGGQIFSALIFENSNTAKSAPIATVYANQHHWLERVFFCRDIVGCVLFVTLLNRLRDSERGFVEGWSFLWIPDMSTTAVNCACFVLNDERPFRLTAFAYRAAVKAVFAELFTRVLMADQIPGSRRLTCNLAVMSSLFF